MQNQRTDEINGNDFERMVRNGLANLGLHIEEINALNVFPVPDGDTGSNMYLTLKNAVDQTGENEQLGEYLHGLSGNMLLGARGNSGVILSQLFKGFAERLDGKDEADAGDLCAALISAYRAAYASVQRPVEGTLLTVAREGIEKIRGQIKSSMLIDQLFSYYVAEMRRSLSYTPMVLPALKEAGVVDSGGMGYILIVDGMLKALYGEQIQAMAPKTVLPGTPTPAEDAAFDSDAVFTFGYCMEFLLQLLKDRPGFDTFSESDFSEKLAQLGDSLVVVRAGTRVKVHVHTREPAPIITLAQQHGEFVSFKLENMHLQHNQFMRDQPKKHVPLAVIAVSYGAGITRLYKEFAYCHVIDGGEMMNASCQDFLNGFERVDADCIIVLPNNKNTVSAARQAAELSRGKNVRVLPSMNVVQGYLALSMDIATNTLEERLQAFEENLREACTICLARAVRASTVNGMACNPGDSLAFLSGKALACHADVGTLMRLALKHPDIEAEPEYMQIFLGARMKPAQMESLRLALKENYPDAEVECIESGHAIYDLIISVT